MEYGEQQAQPQEIVGNMSSPQEAMHADTSVAPEQDGRGGKHFQGRRNALKVAGMVTAGIALFGVDAFSHSETAEASDKNIIWEWNNGAGKAKMWLPEVDTEQLIANGWQPFGKHFNIKAMDSSNNLLNNFHIVQGEADIDPNTGQVIQKWLIQDRNPAHLFSQEYESELFDDFSQTARNVVQQMADDMEGQTCLEGMSSALQDFYDGTKLLNAFNQSTFGGTIEDDAPVLLEALLLLASFVMG